MRTIFGGRCVHFPTLNNIVNQIEDFCLHSQCLWADFNLKLRSQGLRRRKRGVGKIFWHGLCIMSSSVEYEQRRSWRPNSCPMFTLPTFVEGRQGECTLIMFQFSKIIKKHHFWNIRLRMLFVGILKSWSTVLGPVHGLDMRFGLIMCWSVNSHATASS